MRLICYLIVSILLLAGCDSKSSDGKKRDMRAHPVEAVSLQRSPLTSRKVITGTLEAPRTVRVHNEEPGKIIHINFHPGDLVKKNDVLIKLDDKIIKAQLDKAVATHKQAVLDHQRIKKLKPRNLASEDQITRAATAVEQARAELALQQTRLDRTQIRAPFDGLISERLKEPGDIVPLHSHILTVYDPVNLIAKVDVSEIILPSIKLNSEVNLRVDALADTELTGTVIRKYPVINSSTRQGTMEIKLTQIPTGTAPGQLVRIQIEGQTRPLPNLPIHTVRHDTRGEYVYRIDENSKAQYTSVKTGIQLGGFIEIVAGLNENDQVVSKGFLRLRNNSKVVIKNSSAAEAKNIRPKEKQN